MSAPSRSDFSLVKGINADGDSVNVLEANTEESLDRTMGEIRWHCRETRQQTEKTNIALICFDLSTFGTKFRNAPLRFSIKNNLLLSLWVCGREARECGQPVGRASDGLKLSSRAFGAVHGLSTRLCSGRSAGMRTRPHIHRLMLALIQTHWLRAHTADCDGGSF